MRPGVWRPPVEPSAAEQVVIKAVRRARLFVFLRQHRHELFDEEFQAEMARTYVDSPKGERTVALAARTGGFGARALRAALDSSPLWGAGRVEDTINLMGHALRKALGVIAAVQGRGQAAGIPAVAAQAGVPQLAASSLKAALDRDWDAPAARDEALAEVLGLLDRVEAFVAGQFGDQAAAAAVAAARQVRD